MKDIFIPISHFAYTKRMKFKMADLIKSIPVKGIITYIKRCCEPDVLYGKKDIVKLIFYYLKTNNYNINEDMVVITKSDLIINFECEETTYGNYIKVRY